MPDPFGPASRTRSVRPRRTSDVVEQGDVDCGDDGPREPEEPGSRRALEAEEHRAPDGLLDRDLRHGLRGTRRLSPEDPHLPAEPVLGPRGDVPRHDRARVAILGTAAAPAARPLCRGAGAASLAEAPLHPLLGLLGRGTRTPRGRRLCFPGRSRRPVGAAVEARLSAVEAERPRGERLEERPVVRHDHADPAEPPERSEEQVAAVRVQVVRRLVEEQHVRFGGEGRPELPALSLAGRAGLPAAEVGGIEVKLAAQLPRLAVLARRELGGTRAGLVHALRAERDPPAGGLDAEPPRDRRERACDEREEGGLAGAVLADETGPAGLEREIGVFQDGAASAYANESRSRRMRGMRVLQETCRRAGGKAAGRGPGGEAFGL